MGEVLRRTVLPLGVAGVFLVLALAFVPSAAASPPPQCIDDTHLVCAYEERCTTDGVCYYKFLCVPGDGPIICIPIMPFGP